MFFGSQFEVKGKGLCPSCHQEKQGIKNGRMVGGQGGGYQERVATCINPQCPRGQKNLKTNQKIKEIKMFGHSSSVEQQGICHQCGQEKEGTKKAKSNGAGWCAVQREVTIAICINPDCPIGKVNIKKDD